MRLFLLLILCVYVDDCFGRGYHGHGHYGHGHGSSHGKVDSKKVGGVLKTVYSWKQMTYDIDGVHYTKDTNQSETERYFIQYNNVPIGLEADKSRVFVTVPARRNGIPSTLNSIPQHSVPSPALKPYPPNCPGQVLCPELVSVYRPRIDGCGRLWTLDTGLLEVPGERRQVMQPSIYVSDPDTGKTIFIYYLKPNVLVNERTPGGLTSITVDVDPSNCTDAYAYITDLATGGLIVFSLAQIDSWRFEHSSFLYEESALNFTVAGYPISWRDGLFSIALGDPDSQGRRLAYYHALMSTKEYAVDTEVLKSRGSLEGNVKVVGERGPLTQSGTHAYHSATKTLLFANVAQDALLCWRVDTEMTPENVVIVAQDHEKLVYISDLKIHEDDVWVLVNQIPRFVYSSLDTNETNYYIHRGKIQDLIKGTACDPTSPAHSAHFQK